MNLEKKNKAKDIGLILLGYGLMVSGFCMFNMHLSNKHLKENYSQLQKQIFIMEDPNYVKQAQDNSE